MHRVRRGKGGGGGGGGGITISLSEAKPSITKLSTKYFTFKVTVTPNRFLLCIMLQYTTRITCI